MDKIYNLTQHAALAAGVFEPLANVKAAIVVALTFDHLPHSAELNIRAECGCKAGGAPFFSSYLERALFEQGINPRLRESVEVTDPQCQKLTSLNTLASFN